MSLLPALHQRRLLLCDAPPLRLLTLRLEPRCRTLIACAHVRCCSLFTDCQRSLYLADRLGLLRG